MDRALKEAIEAKLVFKNIMVANVIRKMYSERNIFGLGLKNFGKILAVGNIIMWQLKGVL